MAHVDAWTELGRNDPLWAVVTEPSMRGRRWDVAEVLALGEPELDGIMAAAARLGLPACRSTALDYGCGVGRLTVPLARRFDTVTAVDVSGPMAEIASGVTGDLENVQVQVVNPRAPLPFPGRSFDLVLSMYVLQHLPTAALALALLDELARLVAPGGLLVVQLAGEITLRHRLQPRRRAYALLRRLGVADDVLFDRLRLSPMRLIGVPRDEVEATLRGAGLDVLAVEGDRLRNSRMDSFTYFASPGGARATVLTTPREDS